MALWRVGVDDDAEGLVRTATEIAMRMAIAKGRRDDAIVRHLLGRWVSEFEPAVAYQNGYVIGLAVAGDPTGSIPVRYMDMRPILHEWMKIAGVTPHEPNPPSPTSAEQP